MEQTTKNIRSWGIQLVLAGFSMGLGVGFLIAMVVL